MPAGRLRIKNWSKHQHFKDRTPPWIKLYREILDDPDWHELDGDSAKLLVSLWLIASEDETRTGTLPDFRRMAFRLRMTQQDLEQGVIKLSHWLTQDDINTISGADITAISQRYQADAPETETEGETEAEILSKQGIISTTGNKVDPATGEIFGEDDPFATTLVRRVK